MATIFDLRRESRGLVTMPGRIRHKINHRCEVAVTNLSRFGCRVVGSADCAVGSTLFVRLDQLAALRTTVRWRSGSVIGLEFDSPLYLPVLDHLMRNWSPLPDWQRSRGSHAFWQQAPDISAPTQV